MKKLALAASAALLVALPGLSLAQEHHEDGGHPGGGGATHAPASALQTPRSAPTQGGGQVGGQQFHGGGQPQFQRGPENGQGFHGQFGGQPPSGSSTQGPSAGQNGYRPQGFANGQLGGGYHPQGAPRGQGGSRPQGFAGGDPGRGGGYGQGGFHGGGGRPGAQPFGYGGHQYFRYQAAPYRYPGGYYGWANHGWRRGEWLPSVFIASTYFINDWYDFGLWQPDYGYQWIRVGADALLINLADGQVVDVVPGVYYY
jgi:Ni/Co efflux regulator RcnB